MILQIKQKTKFWKIGPSSLKYLSGHLQKYRYALIWTNDWCSSCLNVKMIFLVKKKKKKKKKKGKKKKKREEEYKKKECNLILEEMQIVTQPSGKTKLSFVLQNLPAVLFTEMKFHVRTYLSTPCSNKYGLASGSIWIPIQNKKLIFCGRLILQKGYKVNLKAMFLCKRKLINSQVNHTHYKFMQILLKITFQSFKRRFSHLEKCMCTKRSFFKKIVKSTV